PALDELAVGVELADALVVAELRDVEVAVGVLHRVADVAELPRLLAALAAERAQQLALGRVDAEAVVVRIADEEVAVAGDAQAAGPAVAVVRRLPGGAEVLAVAVVDLDAGGEVHDVEAVLVIDGDGPRPGQVAVVDAAFAPDQFRRAGLAATGGAQQ